MMSCDKRQNARTQGKYRNETADSDVKQRKDYPANEKRANKNLSRSEKNDSVLTWCEDQNEHHFPQLEAPTQAKVICKPGLHVLSNTDNGESRIYFEPNFMSQTNGHMLFRQLIKNVKWSDKKVVINGQEHRQPRLVAWFGPLPYEYSGVILNPKEFPEPILKLKRDVESALKKENIDVELNSVLLNLYRNGKDSVAWHSDDESSMGICPTIASVSLGETRRFEMRRKTEERPDFKAEGEYVVHLTNGSLIVMDGVMQQDWLHRVPKEYHDKNERINLTFRTVFPIERVPRFVSSGGRESYSAKVPKVDSPQIPHQTFQFEDEHFPSLGAQDSSTPKPQRDPRRKKFLTSVSAACNEYDETIEIETNDCPDDKEQHNGYTAPATIVTSDSVGEIVRNVREAQNQVKETASQNLMHTFVPKHEKEDEDSVSYVSKFSSAAHREDWDEQLHENVDSLRNNQLKELESCCKNEKHSSGLNANVAEFIPRQQVKSDPAYAHETSMNHKYPSNQPYHQGAEHWTDKRKGQNRGNYSNARGYSNNYDSRNIRQNQKTQSKSPPDKHGQNFYSSEDEQNLKNECKRLSYIYNYVQNSWDSSPFSNRDKRELDTLLLVIDECENLPLKVISAIADRMTTVVAYAEREDIPRPRYISDRQNSLRYSAPRHSKSRTFVGKNRQ